MYFCLEHNLLCLDIGWKGLCCVGDSLVDYYFVSRHPLCGLGRPSVSMSIPCLFLCCRTEQREVRAEPATLVSVGPLHAALRWPSHGVEPPDSSLPAFPAARLGLEAPSGTLKS